MIIENLDEFRRGIFFAFSSFHPEEYPYELWLTIVSKLDKSTRRALSVTCHRANNIGKEWSAIVIQNGGLDEDPCWDCGNEINNSIVLHECVCPEKTKNPLLSRVVR